ncbi:MAG TPA: hypothetical protein VH281_05360 [Gaiellaceae bacterium]|jgi:hypothetical protein
MPSKKQRRRREKLQRHEYEYVIETEDGEEVPIEKPAEPEKRDAKKPVRASQRGGRGGREVPKPSLARVAKRTAIFAPLILIIVWVFSPSDVGTASRIFNAVLLIGFFIPFSYLVDALMYRMFSKRQQRSSGSG